MAASKYYTTSSANWANTTMTPFPAPSALFLAVHTESPTPDCSLGELPDGVDGYTRMAIALISSATATSDDLENEFPIVFNAATATNTDDLEYFSIWDAQVGGNPIFWGKLASPVLWTLNASLAFSTGMIRVELYNDLYDCVIAP